MLSTDTLWNTLSVYLRSISSCKSATEAVHLSSVFLNRPVLLIDLSMHLVAYSPKENTGDDDWDTVTRTGCVTPVYVALSSKTLTQHSSSGRITETMFHFPATDQEMEKYRCMLTMGTVHFGSIMVLSDHRPFTPDDITALQLVCQSLSRCLYDQLYPAALNQHTQHTHILYDLLTQDPHRILSVMEKRHPSLYLLEGKPLVTGYVQATPGDYLLSSYWQRVLTTHLPQCQLLPYQGELLFFSPLGTMSYRALCDILESSLVPAGFRIGLSDPFMTFLSFKTQYENARQVCLFGLKQKPNQRLYTVGNLRLALMTAQLSQDEVLRSQCHPAAYSLRDYDATHGTQYCRILLTYLTHFHNYSLAAQALYMHRNTLTYHLERIERLLQLDLNDPKLCAELQLSLMLLQEDS